MAGPYFDGNGNQISNADAAARQMAGHVVCDSTGALVTLPISEVPITPAGDTLVSKRVGSAFTAPAAPFVGALDQQSYGPVFSQFRRPTRQQRTPLIPAAGLTSTFGAGHGFVLTGSGGTWADDTTDFAVGSQSLKLTTAGNNAVASAQHINLSPTWNISNSRICVAIKCDKWEAFNGGGSIAFYFSSDNLSTQFFTITGGKFLAATGGLPLNNEWVILSFSPGDWNAGTTVLTAINAFKVQVQDNNQQFHLWVGGVWTEPLASEGMLSFTFDDGFKSTFTQARAYMDKYAYAGSVFPICDLIDVAGAYMTTPQIQMLHDVSGWDVGVHAYNAAAHDFTGGFPAIGDKLTEAQFQQSLLWLKQRGISRGPEMLAWPLGIFDAKTLAVAKRYFRLARTTNAGSGNNVEGRYPPDLMRLKCRGVTSADSVTTINNLIDQAVTNKEWLILLFHDIGNTGQMSVPNFQLVVDHANSSGIKVRTLGDALTLA